MNAPVPSRAWFFVVVLALAVLAGCSGGPPPNDVDPTQERLVKIGLAYREYCDRQMKAPAGAEDLNPLLKAQGADDTVWNSARDQQPFVVVWGLDLRQPPVWAGDKLPVLAYERLGKSGKRFVRTIHGATLEMSAAEFTAAAFPPGHTPE